MIGIGQVLVVLMAFLGLVVFVVCLGYNVYTGTSYSSMLSYQELKRQKDRYSRLVESPIKKGFWTRENLVTLMALVINYLWGPYVIRKEEDQETWEKDNIRTWARWGIVAAPAFAMLILLLY